MCFKTSDPQSHLFAHRPSQLQRGTHLEFRLVPPLFSKSGGRLRWNRRLVVLLNSRAPDHKDEDKDAARRFSTGEPNEASVEISERVDVS